MKLHEALALPCLEGARLVSARSELGRELSSAHVVDLPEPFSWLRPGQLLLTTGMHWPTENSALRAYLRGYAEAGVAVLGLAVPHFLPGLPDAARQEAELLGLPVLEIPWATPFADIVSGVQDSLLSRQLTLSLKAEQIHRTLTRAAAAQLGPPGLCRTLGELLDRPTELRGPDLELLARWPVTGGLPAADLAAHLERLGLERTVWRGSQAQVVPGEPKALVCPVRVAKQATATLWALEDGALLTELDGRALEHAAVVFGLTLAQEGVTRTLEARLGYSFVDSVLEGRFDPSPQSQERARAVGFDPQGDYRLLLLQLPEATPLSSEGFERRERLAQEVRRHLQSAGAAALVTVAQEQLTVLLTPEFDAEAIWSELHPRFKLTGLLTRPGPAAALPQGYLAARALIAHAAPGTLTRDTELLVQAALAGDPQAQHVLTRRWLGPLDAQPKLLETLRVLVAQGYSLKNTAAALGLHANTLRYRLERLESLLGVGVTDPALRFELELAVRLHRISEMNSNNT
jgi:PucR family transcriptional regulator, purine catabolism regulatory protein